MQAHEALKLYLVRKRKASPRFSLRALARRLEISPSFLSRVLNGEKPIPSRLLPKLARALDVEPELLSVTPPVRKKPRAQTSSPGDAWKPAPPEASQVLRTWYFIAVLEVTTLADFDGSLESIARRLSLSRTSVEIAVRELLDLGLLSMNGDRLLKTDEKIRIPSSTPSAQIRKFHHDLMTKCQELLKSATSEEDFEKRLVAGITLSCTPEAVQAAKRKLNQCLYDIANDLTASPGTEVYHLATQLFPLTRR